MSRRLPADGVARIGKTSSEGRVGSPRASSSLGPDETSELKASVPGTGLVCSPTGGGVRVPRERPVGDPAGGGASHAPLLGRTTPGVEAGWGAKGSDPVGGAKNGREPGWEPAALAACKGAKAPPAEAGSSGATSGGPNPGAAAASADAAEPGGTAAAGQSPRDAGAAVGMSAAGPWPAGTGDGARGGLAAVRMTVTAPMT